MADPIFKQSDLDKLEYEWVEGNLTGPTLNHTNDQRDAWRVQSIKRIRSYIIDAIIGSKLKSPVGKYVESQVEATIKLDRTRLEGIVTEEYIGEMVDEWGLKIRNSLNAGYTRGEIVASATTLNQEAITDAILDTAFTNEDTVSSYLNSVPRIIDLIKNESDLTEIFFLDTGSFPNAYLTQDKQIGYFLTNYSPIHNPENPTQLIQAYASNPRIRSAVREHWPTIIASMMDEEAAKENPSFNVGIGKIIQGSTDPDGEHAWVATLFGPTEARPDVPANKPMRPEDYMFWKAREDFYAGADDDVLNKPVDLLKGLLPDDTTLEEILGDWAVKAKSAFITQFTKNITDVAGYNKRGIGTDYIPDARTAAALVEQFADNLIAGPNSEWNQFLARAERNYYANSSNRISEINKLLGAYGYQPEAISQERKNELALELYELGNIRDFKARYPKAAIDNFVSVDAYDKFADDFDTWAEVKAVVEEWLGPIEVTEERKNQFIQRLIEDMPSLREFTDSPEDRNSLKQKLEITYGSSAGIYANEKRNLDLLQSTTAIPSAIRSIFGMDANMQIDNPELYAALEGKGRLRLEQFIRDKIESDIFSNKTPAQLANELMQGRGITPSGDIDKYPRVWTGTEYINYEPEGGFAPDPMPVFPADPRLTEEFNYLGGEGFSLADIMGYQAAQRAFDVPTSREELNADYIRRLEEAGLPRAIIDFETRRITDEYQKEIAQKQSQGILPTIPEEFINFARDYGTFDVTDPVTGELIKGIPPYDFFADIDEQLASGAIDQETYDALVAQQVGDPTFARLTDADFPTREGLLGGIRDEFSGSAAGREFIERQISEGNIDFSDIDTRLGEIRQREGLRHPQTMPADPMALVPSFTQQQLPTLAQDFAQEQQEERARRGELTGLGSTIFRRRTL